MKLENIEKFEIQAEAFRIMSGHMAPGKDASPHSYSAPYEEREASYKRWNEMHGECVRAMLLAVERVLPPTEPGERANTIFNVYHAEEWVGTFLQASFSTREKAEHYLKNHDKYPESEMYIEEYTLDSAVPNKQN